MNILKWLRLERSMIAPLWAVAFNILTVYILFTLLRVEYLLENFNFFEPSIAAGHLWELMRAGVILDTPGIFYFNILYIVMMLLPLHWKENPRYYRICHVVFVILNSLAILISLADSVYFSYTLKRTTWDIFSEFGGGVNLGKIAGVELLRHWYLVLLAAVLIFGLCKIYATPSPGANTRPRWLYYILSGASLVVVVVTAVAGMRGGLLNRWWQYIGAFPLAYLAWRCWKSRSKGKSQSWACGILGTAAFILVATAPIGKFRHKDIRPLEMVSAAKYASRSIDNALILNTPFTLLRTMGKQAYPRPQYYKSEEELAAVYTPVHQPPASAPGKGKNVVIIILESFGKEYIGSLNKEILGADYKGYTPFLDSLISVSTTWRHTYDNGRKSIDVMPSVLAGIPQFVYCYLTSPASTNNIDGLPAILGREGYSSAFFHGARRGTMGFDGFACTLGFDQYYGSQDFLADGRFGGQEEFDGYWGIWDEPFLQYFAGKIGEMKPPFLASIFTLTSHHPFNIPEKYKSVYKDGDMEIYKTIRYTDNALRQFFDTASKQPWFENTIFIITNDHTNARAHDEYRTDVAAFDGPIIIYDPSGDIAPGMREGIAQQTDIMPTVLNYVGAKSPYVAFGKDLLSTSDEESWAVNSISAYQYMKYGLLMRFDGEKVVDVYDINDKLMKENIRGKNPEKERIMEREIKAIIQQYMNRVGGNKLTP